jgi:antagonist of KipI
MFEFLEVITPGCGATWQDAGRPRWKRFGVPPGGWMDAEAAHAANRLVGNDHSAVVVELALQGSEQLQAVFGVGVGKAEALGPCR